MKATKFHVESVLGPVKSEIETLKQQIAFSGFDTSDLSKRVEELNKIVNDLNPAVKPLHIGHFFSGPRNAQQ
eukprot:1812323-Pyramimonas_sp.AAC.1